MPDREQKLAEHALRLFGKEAFYKPDSDNMPCRVQVDEGVDQMADTAFRETMLTFLVRVIGKHEEKATLEVPELGQTFRIGKLIEDDGYLRTVQAARL
ncbi:hypothetical protein ACL7TT_10075 [Microbulbifer sp. 2304DJ12-6]|uniref:hypothetical protein n=1 Tax=Microbulbifer sp. 2304DJ12-6 TaxID=3233340 RepID=UPI0039AFC1B8